MSNALTPRGTQQDIVDILNAQLDEAEQEIVAEHGDRPATEAEIRAEVIHRMLLNSENHRSTLRVAQAFTVAYAAREQIWRFHPDEFSNLRQFLRSTGMGESTVSDLTALGNILVPFCDHHDIPLDSGLTPQDWPKMREAIPAMRQAVRNHDQGEMTAILADVKQATNRDAIRVKYRKPRQKYGQATTLRPGSGEVILVAVLDDNEATEAIIRRLSGGLEWSLLATLQDNTVTIHNA